MHVSTLDPTLAVGGLTHSAAHGRGYKQVWIEIFPFNFVHGLMRNKQGGEWQAEFVRVLTCRC